MDKLGGFGMIVVGVFLLFMGLILVSGILEWLLRAIGIVTIVGGAIIGIFGIVRLATNGGGSGGSYDY